MDNRSFIQMGELSHIVRLVKLCGVDFLHAVRMNISLLKQGQYMPIFTKYAIHTYASIIALHQQLTVVRFFYHPAPYESCLWISEPNVAFSRKVVFALDCPYPLPVSLKLLSLDERRRKGI